MDNTDANSASNTKDATGQQVQVIKIYPLDGKPVAESQLWISVIQIVNEVAKRLFLRDGQQHRVISTKTALSLLSSENKKDLSAILKRVTNKGGSAPTIAKNSIAQVQNNAIHQSLNQIIHQKFFQVAAAQNMPDAAAGNVNLGSNFKSPIFEDNGNVLNTTSTSQIVIESLVRIAQLRSWGTIKVSGSEYFRKQVWLEAAAQGMYIEGYVHTAEDRRALFMRIPESAYANIRSEYKPMQTQKKKFLKPVTEVAGKTEKPVDKIQPTKSTKQKNLAGYVQNNVQNKPYLADLSQEELTYLLMRLQQMDLNNRDGAMMDNGLSANNDIIDNRTYVDVPFVQIELPDNNLTPPEEGPMENIEL